MQGVFLQTQFLKDVLPADFQLSHKRMTLTAELLLWQRWQAETQALTSISQLWTKYKTDTNEQEYKNRLNTFCRLLFFSWKTSLLKSYSTCPPIFCLMSFYMVSCSVVCLIGKWGTDYAENQSSKYMASTFLRLYQGVPDINGSPKWKGQWSSEVGKGKNSSGTKPWFTSLICYSARTLCS